MHWVVVANSNLYRIYKFERTSRELMLLAEMEHPESKLKNRELVTDRPGHYKTPRKARGSFVSHADPRQEEIDQFVRTLANRINHGRNEHQYEQLILVASPRIYGILWKHLDKQAQKQVKAVVQKDYTQLTMQEIFSFLQEHWRELQPGRAMRR